jgi:hypothetical protein
MIQIDGIGRQVFIRFTDHFVQDILNATNGQTVYKHATGDISPVRLMIAWMGTRRVRLANLSPELPNTTVRNALSQYGDVQSIKDDTGAKHYRYTVSNRIRIVMMTSKKHIPSHITVTGYRALTSYDGQPQTCYGCQRQRTYVSCLPKAQGSKTMAPAPVAHTWANIVASTTTPIDFPGTSDAVNMDTDPGSLEVGARMPSATSDGQGEPIPASLEGRQPACDAPPSRKIPTSNQVCRTPTAIKWADEDPDFEQTSSAGAKPLRTSLPP